MGDIVIINPDGSEKSRLAINSTSNAIFDTGSSHTVFSMENVDALHVLLGFTPDPVHIGFLSVNCTVYELLPDIQFEFGGALFNITRSEYTIVYGVIEETGLSGLCAVCLIY
jgi:hypothetical protein